MKSYIILLGGAMALAACSSADEQLCRRHINASLINPETAKFSDFREIVPEEGESNGIIRGLPDIVNDIIPKEGAHYYHYKVRAEGKLGNTITSQQLCAIDASGKQCFCFEAE